MKEVQKKMSVKVNITVKKKGIKLPAGTRMLIRRACIATLVLENWDTPAEVDVSLVDDKMIHEINLEFRNIDRPTDVLSFPLGENGEYDTNPETGAVMLGDVVISVETAVAQAERYGHSVEREIAFLTVHSMLHLLGYDHVNGGLEQRIMRDKEEAVLDAMGLAVNKV